MPPPWHSLTASIASLRGGSRRPISPSRTRVLGRSAGPRRPALTPGFSSHASASTRSPWAASRSDACTKCALSSDAAWPFVCWRSQCSRMTSGAFYKQYPVAEGRLVQRRHEFVFRLERDGINPRRGRLLGSAIHTELAREGIERSLGGIAFYFPRPSLLEQLGIVAKHRDAAHKREYKIVARWFPVSPHFAFRRIALAGDLIRGLGSDGRHHHHLHQSECAGFVGADPRYRT